MSWIKKQDQGIDQRVAFESIQLMFKFVEEELTYETENNEFLELFEQQVFNLCQTKSESELQTYQAMIKFLNEDLKNDVNFFKNMIKDKEKMLEQDIKEIEKIKKQTKDRSKIEQKLKDISYLIKEIDKNLEIGTAEKLYGLLEIIESKAVIGLFQYQNEYQEIQQYLKNVDLLFKSRNFQQDKFEIINLISMVKNVLLDLHLNIIIKLQEDQLDEYEAMSFFENSKVTHQIARDYFQNELQTFLQTLISKWENIILIQEKTNENSESFRNLIQQLKKQNTKIIETNNHSLQIVNFTIKHLEQDFLEQRKRQ
ncbi:unnamed protein product (macronuclear) [Paramecium tetraurelia]|uniref:Uncharacterized protein n=1 Tax=Paramecium tetraurelia TaxID=5888 RepID=A0DT53_PARTE|nr:uncharacterized protein GSPATT00019913001 [Paramecium tetraurelia]CAK86220.1 unnamed protein product [Paramecium tetraurelia]|eukprot:XP_001453617.1 hypothetical protein (macronuclear) [Paramecium tetraurelia strain d4-2]